MNSSLHTGPIVCRALTPSTLRRQNQVLGRSGGCSRENRHLGFRPAFYDQDSDRIYPSCFADGSPAPFHLLDGLPACLVTRWTERRQAAAVKASVIAGFVRGRHFYTRSEAADALSTEH